MNNKILHYGLIVTFAILYLATAFVSFYHAIEFFNLSNERWLSVILSLVAEIGQATVLFSLLMSSNKSKIMPWVIMFILTALQVIGNVYSCYVFIEEAASPRFLYFQKSILFFIEESPETMKVIVAWITGSLLPIIALCLTSLVAENLHLKDEDYTLNTNETDATTEPTDTTQAIQVVEDEVIPEQVIEAVTEPLQTVESDVCDAIQSDTPCIEVEPIVETPIEKVELSVPTETKIKKAKTKRVRTPSTDKIITEAIVPNTQQTNNIENISVK